jgi:LysM repeat protein
MLAARAGGERGDSNPTPPTVTIDDTFHIATATAPGSGRRTPTPEGMRVYIVAPGDTLSSIAAQFGVTEGALIEANNLSDPDAIDVGQLLLIPPADGESG